ncbi:restriction endonuclease subunit S [Thiocapsa sp.]|uniref:restriction endonuclease subunit S n=1 Tax=Thiocapsa sp. TaxID=2024551 RepID=UPI003592FA47
MDSLENLIDVKHGFAFAGEHIHEEPRSDVLLTPGNFAIGGGFKADKFKYYDGPVPGEYVLDEGDLIVTMTDLSKQADTLGFPAFVPPARDGRRFLHNQRLGKVLLRNPASLETRYLYYVMCGQEYRHEVLASATGTTVKHTSPDRIRRFRFSCAPLPEQRAIAHILGTLDDKIELNRRMNETLEAMARALFKSWFVDFDPVRAKAEGRARQDGARSGQPRKPLDGASDLPWPGAETRAGAEGDPGQWQWPQHILDLFPARLVDSELGEIPEGWEAKVLDDLSGVVLGGDWGVDEPTPDHTRRSRCIRGADIPDLQAGGMGKMPVRYLKPSSLEKRGLSDGDLVVEISGGSPTQSTGRAVLVSDRLLQRLDAPLVCSNFCRLLKPKKQVYSKFLYLWLRALYSADEFLQFENGTTGIKNLAFTLFSSRYKLCAPSNAVLTAFETQVVPVFSRQRSAAAEANSLAALRDTLLPKLISGELRLRAAEKLLQAAV